MNDQTEGIVLSQIDYKDNDAIISVLTKTFGKVSLYVKGYKKITSKNVYATQLFDCSTFLFDYSEAKNTSVLKNASLINEFAAIKADYDKLVVCSVIAEIVNNCHDEQDYEFVMRTFKLLNDTNQPFLILNLFLVDFILKNGIAPYVDGCALCDDTNHIETISIQEGGFICHNCNQSLHLPAMDVELLKKFRVINKANYDVMDKLVGYNEPKITALLMELLSIYSGMHLKSAKSLEKLL